MSKPNWKTRLPMWLTWSRMGLSLPIMVLMQWPEYFGGETPIRWLTTSLFVIASITDWLDGYYARKFSASTTMGQFMDPIADKVLVSSILVLLAAQDRIHPFLVVVLLNRDILIGGIRSVAAADQLIISAKPTGKWKTGVQMVGIPLLLFDGMIGPLSLRTVGHGLLWLSAVLSITSAWEYIEIYRKSPRRQRTEKDS